MLPMKRSFLFFPLLLVLSCQASCQSKRAEFDDLMNGHFQKDGPGGVALVVKDGKILYRKARGMASLEFGVPMTPEHVFRIGSITKQFTACAILKLAEEDKLDLKDEITRFIEDYPTRGHVITIEHLLTHTSGIRSYTDMDEWNEEFRKKDMTPAELVNFFKDEPMDFAPGEEWRYNNSAYFLLGYIVEIVSGMPYADYIQQNFFGPLGMDHSFYGSTSRIIPGRAAGYAKDKQGYRNDDYLSMTQPGGAGALLSTVDDLYTWYTAVFEHRVISEKSLKQATGNHVLNNGELTGYGYGWFVGNSDGKSRVSHNGGINGYLSSSIYFPEEKLFVAVFSNCTCKDPGPVAQEMATLALDVP